MKKTIRTLWCMLAVGTVATALPSTPPATAQPSSSPSAVAAARLKHRPPRNWIRHYLGDDRYKIAGGIWKVVSTEMDEYYYPAWAPEMLHQPADIVLGFSSPEEAEEAGYRPSAYPMGNALYGLTPAEIAAARNRASGAKGVSNLGTRITLSDGRSTVILPRGWKHVKMGSRSQSTSGGNVSYQMDAIVPSGGNTNQGVVFAFTSLPSSVNLEEALTPESIKQLGQQMGSVGDPRLRSALQGTRLQSGTLGGLRAMTVTPGPNARSQMPAGTVGRLTIAARGSKMYMMFSVLSGNNRGFSTVLNSFQPR